MYGILIEDFDDDGNMDLLMAGNFYVSEVETGRADAGIGSFMRGDGEGGFDPVKVTQSGFFASKDVRDMKLLNLQNGQRLVLVANNNDKCQVFRINDKLNSKNLAYLD